MKRLGVTEDFSPKLFKVLRIEIRPQLEIRGILACNFSKVR